MGAGVGVGNGVGIGWDTGAGTGSGEGGTGMGRGAGGTVGGCVAQADSNRMNNHGLARNSFTGEDGSDKNTRRV